MYYANCEWYVDMGEHNKPLCERKSLRPAKCSECPVYIRSIEEENAKLRELCTDACRAICKMYVYIDGEWNHGDAHADPTYGPILRSMRELRVEVDYD